MRSLCRQRFLSSKPLLFLSQFLPNYRERPRRRTTIHLVPPVRGSRER